MHQALRLVSLVVDGELDDDQIGLHRTVAGDVAVIADDAELAGRAADARFNVADMCAVVGCVPFADGLIGLARVAHFLRGNRTRALCDGAAQEGDRRGLAIAELLQHTLDTDVVAGAQAAAGDHLAVGGRIESHGRVGVNLGDCVAVVQVELDGGRGDVLRFDELEQKLLRRLVAVGPLLLIHDHDVLGAIGGNLHTVAAAAAAQFPGEAEGEGHDLVGQVADDADADAVHELTEALGRAKHFQNVLIVNAADHLGESYKAVTIDINGVAAYAVIARQAADRLVQQHIKSRAFGRWVLGCDLVQHRFLHSFLNCLCLMFGGLITGQTYHLPLLYRTPRMHASHFLLCILSIFAVFTGLPIVFCAMC